MTDDDNSLRSGSDSDDDFLLTYKSTKITSNTTGRKDAIQDQAKTNDHLSNDNEADSLSDKSEPLPKRQKLEGHHLNESPSKDSPLRCTSSKPFSQRGNEPESLSSEHSSTCSPLQMKEYDNDSDASTVDEKDSKTNSSAGSALIVANNSIEAKPSDDNKTSDDESYVDDLNSSRSSSTGSDSDSCSCEMVKEKVTLLDAPIPRQRRRRQTPQEALQVEKQRIQQELKLARERKMKKLSRRKKTGGNNKQQPRPRVVSVAKKQSDNKKDNGLPDADDGADDSDTESSGAESTYADDESSDSATDYSVNSRIVATIDDYLHAPEEAIVEQPRKRRTPAEALEEERKRVALELQLAKERKIQAKQHKTFDSTSEDPKDHHSGSPGAAFPNNGLANPDSERQGWCRVS